MIHRPGIHDPRRFFCGFGGRFFGGLCGRFCRWFRSRFFRRLRSRFYCRFFRGFCRRFFGRFSSRFGSRFRSRLRRGFRRGFRRGIAGRAVGVLRNAAVGFLRNGAAIVRVAVAFADHDFLLGPAVFRAFKIRDLHITADGDFYFFPVYLLRGEARGAVIVHPGILAGQFPGNGIAFFGVGVFFRFLQAAGEGSFFGIAGVRMLMGRRVRQTANVIARFVLAVLAVPVEVFVGRVPAAQLPVLIIAVFAVLMGPERLGKHPHGFRHGIRFLQAARQFRPVAGRLVNVLGHAADGLRPLLRQRGKRRRRRQHHCRHQQGGQAARMQYASERTQISHTRPLFFTQPFMTIA